MPSYLLEDNDGATALKAGRRKGLWGDLGAADPEEARLRLAGSLDPGAAVAGGGEHHPASADPGGGIPGFAAESAPAGDALAAKPPKGVTLIGGPGTDFLSGGGGKDFLDGRESADWLLGALGADTLVGGEGADTLDGGGGADRMLGGPGPDLYVVDHPADKVVESAGQGRDTVWSSVGFRLGAGVEDLVLTGAGSINGFGNNLRNLLAGNSGRNALKGLGGKDTMLWSAEDTFNGGAGGDTLRVTAADMTLDLTALPAGQIRSVEVIDLTGSGRNTVKLDAQDVLDISSSNTLRIEGDAGDSVERGLDWVARSDVTIGNDVYRHFTRGAATLLVDADVASML